MPVDRHALVPPPLEEDLGWGLETLARSYRELTAGVLAEIPHGTRGYQVLAAVHRCDHPTQAALGSQLGIDRTVLTYLLDDLERAGLVERQVSEQDRRRRRVAITRRGTDRLGALCRRVAEAEAVVLAGLDAQQREALRRLVTRAVGATAPEPVGG